MEPKQRQSLRKTIQEDKELANQQAYRLPELDELLLKRDYLGAISLLKFRKREDDADETTGLWLGYCAFHAGQYSRAIEVYETLLRQGNCPQDVHTYLACCYYFLDDIEKSKAVAEKAPKNPLQNRLLLHVYDRLEDDGRVKKCHSSLTEADEDVLALAAVHYRRGHYQEAFDTYKKVLSIHKDYSAVNVYLALCYYKMDYYDVSSDTVKLYLLEHPDSPFALNLLACTAYKLYNSKAADLELRRIDEDITGTFLNAKNLVAHNKVVFRDGDEALLSLPSLTNTIPEARLNLIKFHLHRDDLDTAFKMLERQEPRLPQEYLLQATTYYKLAIEKKSAEYRKTAIKLFLAVGESANERDTVAGRQAMASALFLSHQLDEVLVYLDSIKTYFEEDDVFNYNFGQALVANGKYAEAEETLSRVADQKLKKRLIYILNLVRAYCMNNKGALAWKMCSKWKQCDELPAVLQVIANDCYEMEDYYYSALAFEMLEQVKQNPAYWEGKKNAICGIIKNVVKNRAPRQSINEAIKILERSEHPEAAIILDAILQFCEVNDISLS